MKDDGQIDKLQIAIKLTVKHYANVSNAIDGQGTLIISTVCLDCTQNLYLFACASVRSVSNDVAVFC